MTGVFPNRTFKLLLATGLVSSLLLGAALARALLIGCPDILTTGNLVCLFIPDQYDAVTHLVSYSFTLAILTTTCLGLLRWHRQQTNTMSLARNLMVLKTPDTGLQQVAARLGLKGRVYRLDCESPLCFCAGVFSSRIYISQGLIEKLTPQELEAVLLHEKNHLHSHDPLKLLLGILVVSALFFIPVLKDLFQRYLIEKEIAADLSAVRYQGHSRGIAGTLYKMAKENCALGELVASAGDALGYRIDYLTGDKAHCAYRISALRLAISLLIIALIIASILIPLPSHF